MLNAEIDSHKGRDVVSMDFLNAFIQTNMPVKSDEERVIMKIRGNLLKWLVEIDVIAYQSLVVVEQGER